MWSCPCSSSGPGGKGPLEGIIKGIVSNIGSQAVLTEEAMAKMWKGAAGAKAARHSKPVRLRGSSLIVNVDGSSWLYELTLNKKAISKKLGEKIARATKDKKKIKDIRFRIGEV
ncbi:DciA family protein [Candidatus Omnitrophota bacterium]